MKRMEISSWKSKWTLVGVFILMLGVSYYLSMVPVSVDTKSSTEDVPIRPYQDEHEMVNSNEEERDVVTSTDEEWVSPVRPHILFILVDDLGYNDVGYHNPHVRSPTIDHLAKTGVRLENYYVANQCSPSRAQLMTGRYQSRNGIFTVIKPQWDLCLALNEVTMAEVLRDAGYSTHLVGKWHLGHSRKECTPTYRGFDSFLGFLSGSEDHNSHLLHWIWNGKAMGGYDFYENERPAFEYRNQYSTHIFSKRTIDIIEKRSATNESKPLFIFLSIQAVHTPLEVPDEYKERNKHIKNPDRRAHLSMVTCVDDAIANITNTLKKHDMWKDTLLIFSTDNGGPVRDYSKNQELLKNTPPLYRMVSSNWPLRGGKGTNWEGGVRGAAFVNSPLLSPEVRGTENKELMGLVDWLPTLAGHLAGGNIRNLRLDGYNIWDTIRKGHKSPREELLHDVRVNANDRLAYGAIRVGRWKLVHEGVSRAQHEMEFGTHVRPYELESTISINDKDEPKNKTTWLFNIEDDPLELNDLSEEMPERTISLKAHLTKYAKYIVPYTQPKDDPLYDPRKRNGTIGPWL